MSAVESKNLFGGKPGTYHWDDVVQAADPHGFSPHLQIHTFEGPIVRIHYPSP